jgi:hypothetical protein
MYPKYYIIIQEMMFQRSMISDSDPGGSSAEEEPFDKANARKSQRVPILRFILLFAAVVLTIIVLEYFM